MKIQKKDFWKLTKKKKKKRRVKRCINQNKKESHEQFGRKMNEDVSVNRELFWKEVSKANGGKVENCS